MKSVTKKPEIQFFKFSRINKYENHPNVKRTSHAQIEKCQNLHFPCFKIMKFKKF